MLLELDYHSYNNIYPVTSGSSQPFCFAVHDLSDTFINLQIYLHLNDANVFANNSDYCILCDVK